MPERTARVERSTAETQIRLSVNLDGEGRTEISTGVEFFDHMLVLLARHSLIDLTLKAVGDTGVDAHHTVEDVGICLGKAFLEAVGDKKGIARYGFFLLPMDEALARVALDLSNRPYLEWRVTIPGERCGTFETCLGREFMRAFAFNAGITMHVDLFAADDPHHALEAIFKAVGRSLRMALAYDAREKGVPSSKGVL
ncbi:MAG: imidazoleglycerol-phosphate dehydratase HisB [Planctomycetes bacterium]|nr:imidazoleglycerol-phosphate dehydratase HisB [Planctomycetota bacterium]MCD7897922.1 imidazoleglycerol-phosphate dehydratase HisB [Planctomycetaceae bacterium]